VTKGRLLNQFNPGARISIKLASYLIGGALGLIE